MGLDCLVVAKPREGFEAEWRDILSRTLFNEEEMTDAEQERLESIGIPAYATLGAPRVGFDARADAWFLAKRPDAPEAERRAAFANYQGYHVLELADPCDGIPGFSNAGLYNGPDETSLRGQFLGGCESYIPEDVVTAAWGNMWPEEAVAYGDQLLAFARRKDELIRAAEARMDELRRQPEPGFFSRLLGGGKPKLPAPPEFDAFEFLEVAGKWYRFWGARGHPIQAYF